ncbi:DUF4363 family protein [Bacillus tianshenii]|nr:DUF4363 family protein [Bacillus tianshenii]
MKHLLIYIISGLFIVVSIVVMTSGQWVKDSYSKNDQVLEAVQAIEAEAKQKNWERAEEKAEYLTKAWEKVVNRIQYSVERESINDVTASIYQMKGAIEAKDASAVQQNTAYFYKLWKELGR